MGLREVRELLVVVAGAAVQESGALVPPGWEELRDRVAALGVSLDEAIASAHNALEEWQESKARP